MESTVTIGKYTLESLTAGMYSSPLDLFREYIQNSVDSIDLAVKQGILNKGQDKINVTIDQENKRITIEDNGLGIDTSEAFKKLIDIGNSDKVYSANRGFRGIGRLAGLSYCNKLSFITSTKGEYKKIEVSFDCERLKELLIPGLNNEYDLSRVLEEVTESSTSQESQNKHFFKVVMEGVEDVEGLLDYNIVEDYLLQVAPLPYNRETFKWEYELRNKLKLRNVEISEYNIFLQNKTNTVQLYKINSDTYLADKIKKLNDQIRDIEIHDITDDKGNIRAVVWYGISSFYGGILDERLKGIRLRKGNILVGDKGTLNSIFKEERFNGWFQGEVHIFDNLIIPNARRDNFERNTAYSSLLKELTKIGDDLSRTIRNVSATRNDKNVRMLNEAETLINKTDLFLEEGFNSQKEKEQIAFEIKETKERIKDTKVNDELNTKRKSDIFRQLDVLFDNVKGATNFKILNISQKMTIEQKKILEKVFETITEECDKKEADRLITEILKKF